MEDLFQVKTIRQRKIMEWLTAQNVTREDVARAELRGPGLIRITNPAGQYMDLLCDQDHKVTILTITPEREDQLNYFWENETNDPDTSEWRDELTPEEMALVNEWDDRYESGLLAISRDVLKMERQAGRVPTGQFDRVIYTISQDMDVYISPHIARQMLGYYMDNEAWTYRNARENNLPWVMAEADRNHPLFGRRIKRDSDLCRAISERCPEIRLESIRGNNRYVKVASANHQFVDLSYHFMSHDFVRGSADGQVKEQICFRVVRGQAPALEEIYSKVIEVDANRFIRLCQTPPEKSHRDQRLLKIAAEML